ncbi:hypothetical protein MKZ15_06170 [Paenibacillus sp. FSL R7-0216]|uniref:hypothetical protein n=1 Tax=Paenibacillus sp. FSL R7-0216 TaxID=2921677 RepID=UPI0030DD1624
MEIVTKKNRNAASYDELKYNPSLPGYILKRLKEGQLDSEIILRIGDYYTVIPDNPLKMKHRDRTCEIVEFVFDELKNPIKAKVKFEDNNRIGRVDLSDLKTL